MTDTKWKPPPEGVRFDWYDLWQKGGDITYGEYEALEGQIRKDYGRWFVTGPIATYLGYWPQCRFPACRRARACRAPNPPDHADGSFPPCVHGDSELRNAISGMCSRMEREPGLINEVFALPHGRGRQKDISPP